MKSLKLANTGDFPIAQIMIGTETPWQSKGDLTIKSIDISVSTGNESGRCTVVLSKIAPNFKLGKFVPESEIKVVKQGSPIRIFLGYPAVAGSLPNTYEVFSGFISKVKIDYDRELAVAVIECLDAKMWMMPGCTFEKKIQTKYSSIVNDTLLPAYLGKIDKATVKIQEEPTLSQPVYQTNESDYEFLCRLAGITGCLFYMYCGTAYFISPKALVSDPKAGLSIVPCDSLKKVSWSADVLGLSQQVVIKGVDTKKPKVSAQSKPVGTNLGNIGNGQLPKNIGSATKKVITDLKADTVKTAQFMAQAKFTRKSIDYIKCIVSLSGYADSPEFFKLGMRVSISDMGQDISNTYILTGIKHKFNGQKRTFATDLTLSSDAMSTTTL